MKTEIIFINEINREIIFYIGKSQTENVEVIDNGTYSDLWFHAKNISSCHIVAKIPEDIKKDEIKYIIKKGALLCKNNTAKLRTQKNLEIIYTKLENVTKTNIPGSVIVNNEKTVKI